MRDQGLLRPSTGGALGYLRAEFSRLDVDSKLFVSVMAPVLLLCGCSATPAKESTERPTDFKTRLRISRPQRCLQVARELTFEGYNSE